MAENEGGLLTLRGLKNRLIRIFRFCTCPSVMILVTSLVIIIKATVKLVIIIQRHTEVCDDETLWEWVLPTRAERPANVQGFIDSHYDTSDITISTYFLFVFKQD